MKRVLLTLFLMIVGFEWAGAHSGAVNAEGCHKNPHNDVMHCHRGRGKVNRLPEKQSLRDDSTDIRTFSGRRDLASIKAGMTDEQFRLLEYQCCVGVGYLKKATCDKFGFENWGRGKNCSRSPANLDHDLSIKVFRQMRCFECCGGDEVLGDKYCKDRGFNNWAKGNKCGC